MTIYTVQTEEDPETGDLFMPIPEEAIEKLGWKIGDVLSWDKNDDGTWTLSKKETKVDRFTLEQDIMSAWNIIEDLNLFADNIADKDMSVDDLMNRVMGLSNIYEARFQKMFDTFEKCVKNGSV